MTEIDEKIKSVVEFPFGKMHRKYWLLQWYIYKCSTCIEDIENRNIGIDTIFTCPTPDGDIWFCKDCRYNRYPLEKEVRGEL